MSSEDLRSNGKAEGWLSLGFTVVAVICRRELTRFVRQPARIAAAIGTPALLWLFMGSGFAGSFRPAELGETSYSAFLFPGALTLVAVFAAIFSSISVIEDRNEGWLQSVLVSPAPRWSIALGKIVGGAIVAWAQAAVLLLAIPLGLVEMGGRGGLHSLDALLVLLALAITTFAMTAMGLAFAWRSETTAGFHAIMNLVFMPMWLLSGAFFPPPGSAGAPGAGEGAAAALAWLMKINPLTWCTQAIRNPMIGGPEGAAQSLLPLAAACGFALAMLLIATSIVGDKGTKKSIKA